MTAFRGVRQRLLMLLQNPRNFAPFSGVANILNFETSKSTVVSELKRSSGRYAAARLPRPAPFA